VGFNIPLAIIGLVCLEARVKFKIIDFQTEADFACYCVCFKVRPISLVTSHGTLDGENHQRSHRLFHSMAYNSAASLLLTTARICILGMAIFNNLCVGPIARPETPSIGG
jgi:hypothetical protein